MVMPGHTISTVPTAAASRPRIAAWLRDRGWVNESMWSSFLWGWGVRGRRSGRDRPPRAGDRVADAADGDRHAVLAAERAAEGGGARGDRFGERLSQRVAEPSRVELSKIK